MDGRDVTPRADRVISMTELQKLSLKKLRELRLDEAPLVVRDNKRKRGMFVIVDHDAYQRLVGGNGSAAPDTTRLEDIDFAHYGLFWDRPTMTNEEFVGLLRNVDERQRHWAWTHLLERLPTPIVTKAVTLKDLSCALAEVRLRPPLHEAWEGAIEHWTDKAQRRRT